MIQSKRSRSVRLGPVDLTVAMPAPLADRLTGNRLYTKAVRPTIDALAQSGRGPAGPVVHPRAPVALPDPATVGPEVRELIERVASRQWYHTIDLGHGVVTPGFVDHRDQLPYYSLPASLAGKRCLDIATFDGFWAFEFERRGAEEVVAADISNWDKADVPRLMLRDPVGFGLDQPTGPGFEMVHDLLGSKVQRIERSVYDLDPAEIGTFDLVFISDLLVHLRDPQLALERAFAVCHGEVIVADVYIPELEGMGDLGLAQLTAPSETWWRPNVNCLKQMMLVAGFEPIDEVSRFTLAATATDPIHKVVLRGRAPENPTWFVQALEWKRSGSTRDGATWPQSPPSVDRDQVE